jgi:hypothetical protein
MVHFNASLSACSKLQIFNFFDSLLLLTRGKLAYFGPRADAPRYFAGIGMCKVLTPFNACH